MTNRRQLLTATAGLAAAGFLGARPALAQASLEKAGPLGDV